MKRLTQCLPLVFTLFFISLPAAAQEALCEYACTESTPCDLECTRVETWQRTTCGDFGICGAPPPPPPSCNYVPVTSPFFCHIDIDNHFFTFSIEAEYESFYVDTNGRCPRRGVVLVGNRSGRLLLRRVRTALEFLLRHDLWR
jgi:hypothetical protein